MPTYDAPNNDLKRKAFLETAAMTGANDLAAGLTYLSQDTVDELENTTLSFGIAYDLLSHKLGQRMELVDQTQTALLKVKRHTRDLWEVIRRRVERLGEPVSVLRNYQLTGTGYTPNPGSRREWISLVEAVISGDALTIAKGFPAANNPSIVEVNAALVLLKASVSDLEIAERQYDLAQAAIAELRPGVDLLIRRVMRELLTSLVAMDTPSFRRVARTYGAEYSYSPGETPDEDPAPDDDPIGGALPLVGEPAATG